jgi:hypothetical protein
MDYQKAQIEWDIIELDIGECTCNQCNENCPFRYSIYNYAGDCIMENKNRLT